MNKSFKSLEGHTLQVEPITCFNEFWNYEFTFFFLTKFSLFCFSTSQKFSSKRYFAALWKMKNKRTRSSWPWFGASWQISGFQMKLTVEIFIICLIYDFVKPFKIWVHLDNLIFHCFKEKFKKQTMDSLWIFSLWSQLWNNENKSRLYELKFWEASENHKGSMFWKF